MSNLIFWLLMVVWLTFSLLGICHSLRVIWALIAMTLDNDKRITALEQRLADMGDDNDA